jgi:TonB family protein
MDTNLLLQILDIAFQKQVSDIHFEVDNPPFFRAKGQLIRAKMPSLTAADTELIAAEVLGQNNRRIGSDLKEADDSRKAEIKKDVSLDKPLKEKASGPEETVDLADSTGKYRTYLRDLRRRIESLWAYPQDAYSRSETGTAVVRFSIQNDGTLAATGIVSSSGFESLDRGALAVVQAAAPYAPFPETFSLSTLHIVAKFEYDLD